MNHITRIDAGTPNSQAIPYFITYTSNSCGYFAAWMADDLFSDTGLESESSGPSCSVAFSS